MNDTYMRGYDAGYEAGAKYGQIPYGACFLLLIIGMGFGVVGGFLLAHL